MQESKKREAREIKAGVKCSLLYGLQEFNLRREASAELRRMAGSSKDSVWGVAFCVRSASNLACPWFNHAFYLNLKTLFKEAFQL